MWNSVLSSLWRSSFLTCSVQIEFWWTWLALGLKFILILRGNTPLVDESEGYASVKRKKTRFKIHSWRFSLSDKRFASVFLDDDLRRANEPAVSQWNSCIIGKTLLLVFPISKWRREGSDTHYLTFEQNSSGGCCHLPTIPRTMSSLLDGRFAMWKNIVVVRCFLGWLRLLLFCTMDFLCKRTW